MRFSRTARRQTARFSKSAVAQPAVFGEQLEQKQMLSGVNGGGVDSSSDDSDSDPALVAYRQEVTASMLQLADVEYADRWGQETQQFRYWDYLSIADSSLFSTRASQAVSAERISDTNVQVAGVDEADIVETDGAFLYTIVDSDLVIVSAATDDRPAQIVSRVRLDSQPLAMFLRDGQLTLISRNVNPIQVDLSDSRQRLPEVIHLHHPQTRLTVFDVSDQAQPVVIDEAIIDGHYETARANGGQIYLVVRNNNLPYLPDLNIVADEQSSTGWRLENRDEFAERITKANSVIVPPSLYQRSDSGSPEESFTRLGWLNQLSGEVSVEPESMMTVLRFDLNRFEAGPDDVVSYRVSNFGQTTSYSTSDSLYLTSTQYEFGSRFSLWASDVLLPRSQPSTLIHKIDLTGDQLSISATGEVPGTVESQFSLDEHNGYFRIATTTGNGWGDEEWANHLFILEDVGSELLEVGSIRDLAPTERIYSARFDGDRGWMVTFRQVDPVFSFDLSDPTNPMVTGELKIPGFSDYLQMIDDDHLLAIGRSATEEGRVQGLQVSIFNIADAQQPTLLHRFDFPGERWAHSLAAHNHLAFHYLPEDQLLAIPVNSQSGSELVLLNIDLEDGVSLAGDVGSNQGPNAPWNLRNQVLRSVQIGDRVYSVGSKQIDVIHLSEPDQLELSVPLSAAGEDRWRLENMPWLMRSPFGGTLRLREVINNLQQQVDPQIVLSVESAFEELADQISEFEFRLLDPVTGQELVRRLASEARVVLEDLPELQDLERVQIQARVLRERLANAEFSRWSEPLTVALTSTGRLLSQAVQRAGDVRLQWTSVRDRIQEAVEGQEGLEQIVQSYEVWISDADLMQRIALHTDLDETNLPLNLDAGNYFTWVRAVFEDGSKGEWSPRESLQVLAQAPRLLTSTVATASHDFQVNWTPSKALSQYEVQVTRPDGVETVLSLSDLRDTSVQLVNQLEAGQYLLRVRGFTADGHPSEWSEPVSVTIAGRPVLQAVGQGLSWATNAAQRFEVWVANSANQRIFHTTSWRSSEIANVISEFDLERQQPGRLKIWVRSQMPDGTWTAWSRPETIYHSIPEKVIVETARRFGVAELPVIQWQDAPLIESFEVFVQRVGKAGAFVRQAGLTSTSLTMTEQFPAGQYKVWVRGLLADGGLTRWGDAHRFTVTDTPELQVVDNVATWTESLDADRYELWVNRYDEAGQLLESRALHEREITGNRFDLSDLGEGRYGVWIRSILEEGPSEIRSDWSSRVSVVIERASTAADDLLDVVDDILDDILGDLNLF